MNSQRQRLRELNAKYLPNEKNLESPKSYDEDSTFGAKPIKSTYFDVDSEYDSEISCVHSEGNPAMLRSKESPPSDHPQINTLPRENNNERPIANDKPCVSEDSSQVPFTPNDFENIDPLARRVFLAQQRQIVSLQEQFMLLLNRSNPDLKVNSTVSCHSQKYEPSLKASDAGNNKSGRWRSSCSHQSSEDSPHTTDEEEGTEDHCRKDVKFSAEKPETDIDAQSLSAFSEQSDIASFAKLELSYFRPLSTLRPNSASSLKSTNTTTPSEKAMSIKSDKHRKTPEWSDLRNSAAPTWKALEKSVDLSSLQKQKQYFSSSLDDIDEFPPFCVGSNDISKKNSKKRNANSLKSGQSCDSVFGSEATSTESLSTEKSHKNSVDFNNESICYSTEHSSDSLPPMNILRKPVIQMKEMIRMPASRLQTSNKASSISQFSSQTSEKLDDDIIDNLDLLSVHRISNKRSELESICEDERIARIEAKYLSR